MTKHHWRQQIKSFFESHADPDKHEQLKQSRKEMEEKKEMMIQLIKSEKQDGKTESLEEPIKDYHKQYESLYEDYHNLTGEMNNNIVYSKNGDKGKSSTSSSSDSDSDIDSSSKGTKKEMERVTNELQHKLEAANHEIDELRNKLQINGEKMGQENAELRTKVVDLELNLRCAERKTDDLTLSRGNQSHDQLVIELQTTIEDLCRIAELM